MHRRMFLTGLGALAALVSLGGFARLNPAPSSGVSLSPLLKSQLGDLADPRFEEYAKRQEQPELFTSLIQRGIISNQDGVMHETVAALAQEEPIRSYKGFYYTQTELSLYALALLSSSDSSGYLRADSTDENSEISEPIL